jgi:hypothetical protein
MNLAVRLIFVTACALACGCGGTRGFWSGHGREYRAEYEQRKAAVLAAEDAAGEAEALRELGRWFGRRPYGYTLRAASQPGRNGVDLARLAPGEPVELGVHARSDLEPRPGGFTFVPKDKANLLLLEGNPARPRGSPVTR